MAEYPFTDVMSKWIDNHLWPLFPTDGQQAILVFSGLARDFDVFKFRSAISYFEVSASYHKSTNMLTSVSVALVVPAYPYKAVLTSAAAYLLSTADGTDLAFEFGKQIIVGKLSFKYVDVGTTRNISMKYSVQLPLIGDLEDTVPISPTDLTSGFTPAGIETIPVLTTSEVQMEQEKISAHSTLATDHLVQSRAEHKLLLKFIEDLLAADGNIVMEAHGGLYQFSVMFLNIFELVGSIDPDGLVIAAALFFTVPIVGQVHICDMQGSLENSSGVRAEVNTPIAKGIVVLTAERNPSGKHDLFVEMDLNIKPIGKVSLGDKYRLLTLPF